jgi:hypothetical protein
MALTFERPPQSTDHVMSRGDIAAELKSRPGEWAVVMRPDRMARAETTEARINDGREYGAGYQATVRKIGAEIRVYARFIR